MTNSLTYRLYQEADLPGLLRLWESESGWGAISTEQWRKWYVNTPHGECLVVVAADENGEVVGQEVFTPTRLQIGDREVRALRLSAPILRKDVRRESLRSVDHPVIGLYMTGAEEATAQGYAVVYALPEHGWLPFFRWAPRLGLPHFAEAEFDCLALPLTAELQLSTPDRAGNLRAELSTNFSEEYEDLWLSAGGTFPLECAVVRSPEWLSWKIGGHIVLEVRDHARDRRLSGYVAIKRGNGLLVDALARSPEVLPDVLAAAVKRLAGANGKDDLADITSLRAMATPALRPALEQLGFTPVDYKFAFVCRPLDAALPPEAIAPGRWYIMPKD